MSKPDRIPPLHVVTDDEVVARGDFAEHARAVLEAGGPDVVLHLRAPRASGRALFELARRIVPHAIDADAWLVVNDRAEVALLSADGVHVGARGLRAEDARRVVGGDKLLGVSVHSIEEARDALAGAPDFLFAGAVWPTPSHPGQPGAGVGLIREIAALGVSVIAIGGVTPSRVREARDAGAAGVAAVTGIWNAPDPAAAVSEYLSQWKDR